MEKYLLVNMLGQDPRLVKKEFTGPRSHKGAETLVYDITRHGAGPGGRAVCGRSHAAIADSNPAGSLDVCLL